MVVTSFFIGTSRAVEPGLVKAKSLSYLTRVAAASNAERRVAAEKAMSKAIEIVRIK